MIASLARPGGNLTGVSVEAGIEIVAKRLQIMKEALPSAAKVAFLISGSRPDGVGDDLAAYLSHGGARVIRNSDQKGAPGRALPAGADPAVWVIDAGNSFPSTEELRQRAKLRTGTEAPIVVVAIERGQRRTPRRLARSQLPHPAVEYFRSSELRQ